jgi:uncharacterized delta-60 repeat protein
LAIPQAEATQNWLDPSFGSGGTVTTALSSSIDVARAVAVQPDGKIVAVGDGRNEGEFALVRYGATGSLDGSFGSGGTVGTPVGGGTDSADAIVLQPDGKMLVGGTSYTGFSTQEDFTVARYNRNGSLDTSFGASGIVITDILGHDDAVTGLALQPDGKIVAAGKARTSSAWNVAVVRYNTNGSVDSSFGTNGKVTTSLGSGDGVATALVRQPDGKLLVAGYTGSASNSKFALVRYTAGGSLDPTFGSGGNVTTAVDSGPDDARVVTLQPDGKIVVAGDSSGFLVLARYAASGALDTSFGTAGFASGPGFASAVAVQTDGKIIAAGEDLNDSRTNYDFALSRFEPDGLPDDSFGVDGNGEVRTAFGPGDDTALAVALQPDGKIVAAGTTTLTPGSRYEFALARYLGSTLTITKSGNGIGTVISSPAGINCGPTCSAPFAPVPVTMTAKASAKSSFTGWSGDCSGKGSCTLTENTDHSVTATFTALCIVPKVKGKRLRAAERVIKGAHCSVGMFRNAVSTKVKKGRVISQKPVPGKRLRARSKVRLTISKGLR